MCTPEKKGISSEYKPPSLIVLEALMPCFKHRLKSSGPWLGAEWTIPVPCSKVTKSPSSKGTS